MSAARGFAKFATIAWLLTPAAAFDCVEKKCSEMTSCAEAYYHLEACGEAERDADRDTIPCESICGKTIEEYEKRRGPALPRGLAPRPRQSRTLPGAPPSATGATFACAGKRKCAGLTSCEEARFYLSTCGVGGLDADNDGVPCESLCGGR